MCAIVRSLSIPCMLLFASMTNRKIWRDETDKYHRINHIYTCKTISEMKFTISYWKESLQSYSILLMGYVRHWLWQQFYLLIRSDIKAFLTTDYYWLISTYCLILLVLIISSFFLVFIWMRVAWWKAKITSSFESAVFNLLNKTFDYYQTIKNTHQLF